MTRRGSDLHFRLLRCSTNLSGPTENFSGIDHSVVDALNGAAVQVFDNASDEAIDYGDRFQFSMNDGDYKAPAE